jgi:aspartate racemase
MVEKIEVFLARLRRQNIKIFLQDNQLICQCDQSLATPEFSQQLQMRREEIIEFLKKYQGNSQNQEIIYPRVNQEPVALSFSQQRLWFLSQLEPNSPLYHLYWAIKLQGNLNLTALQKTLSTVIQRHESLRTIFVTKGKDPVQIINHDFSLKIPVIDLTPLPPSQQNQEVQRFLESESRRGFDLTRDLMLRVSLLKLHPQEYVLCFVLHHIAGDGWSVGILFREIVTLYRDFSTGKPPSLPDLKIQYADFALWERNSFQRRDQLFAQQLAYWRNQLKDAPSCLNLPTDKPRPEIQTFRGAHHSITISSSVTQRLKEISQQEQVTLFMTLLAGFQTLLCRYTGDEDILVGTPIANRNKVELENLIGVFINTLILRTHLDGNPTFRELLARVREVTLGAYDNQDLPLEKLIEKLQPERYKSTSPLFQVFFVLQNAPKEVLHFPDITITSLKVENPTAKFDLSLLISETNSELRCVFEYNTDLFEPETITRMCNHWEVLLGEIVANPNQQILDIPILTPSEQRQLHQWNQTQTDYPRNSTINELFESQVEKTPQNIALVWQNQQLTYQGLNSRANQLAHYLQELGISKGVPVGIYLESCLEIIIAIIAILKVGGVYVPLAPSYPQERINFMIDDVGLELILTQDNLKDKLSSTKAQIITIDRLGIPMEDDYFSPLPMTLETMNREKLSHYPQDNPLTGISAEDQAYIMFTSGSTGKPKGVIIPHRGVSRLVKGCDYADFSSEQVFLQLAPISFDASTLEIWGALLNGGKLVLSPVENPSLEQLSQILQHNHITTLWLTSGLFNVIVDQKLEALKGLQQLLIGGDVLSINHVQRFRQQYPQCKLINGYGPTENTTFSCCYQIKNAENLTTSVPIGKPIANTQVYILDRQRQKVPIGVRGEIYIGGDGLAQGYLHRTDLTTERFIDNPFNPEYSAKLYKTGDLGRYLPDGNIEFLGRIDNQVKIRGFRIEPGEIESIINKYEGVRQSIVLPKEDHLGNKQLIAYVTYYQNSQVSVDDLRSYLQDKLPHYMIPDGLMLLDGFPLTTHGKVDYQALTSLNQTKTDSERVYVAPRNDLEEQIALIWEDLLEVKPIGIRDNFFDLGGHSLLALTLFDQLEKLCNATIPMATLFAAPTIEQLANTIRQKGWSSSWLSLVPLRVSGTKPPLFFLHGIAGTVLSARYLGHYLDKEQPLYGIQAQGLQEKKLIHERVEDMAAAYIKEIKTVQPEGPYCLIGVSTGGLIALEMAQQLQAENQQVGFLGLLDTVPPKANFDSLTEEEKQEDLSFWKALRDQFADDEEMIAFLAGSYQVVMNKYQPKPYPSKITFFLASESKPETQAKSILYWCNLAQLGLEIQKVPGTHESMIHGSNVIQLAQKVQHCLNQILHQFPKSLVRGGKREEGL